MNIVVGFVAAILALLLVLVIKTLLLAQRVAPISSLWVI